MPKLQLLFHPQETYESIASISTLCRRVSDWFFDMFFLSSVHALLRGTPCDHSGRDHQQLRQPPCPGTYLYTGTWRAYWVKEAPDLVLVLSCVETTVLLIRIRIHFGRGSALGYGSRSRRAKMTHKSGENSRSNFIERIFLSSRGRAAFINHYSVPVMRIHCLPDPQLCWFCKLSIWYFFSYYPNFSLIEIVWPFSLMLRPNS